MSVWERKTDSSTSLFAGLPLAGDPEKILGDSTVDFVRTTLFRDENQDGSP